MEWSTKNILSINIRWSHGCRGSSACLAVVVVVLGPGVLAPDVQHEHSGNEHQGTHQHWQWTPEKEREITLLNSPCTYNKLLHSNTTHNSLEPNLHYCTI